MRQDNPNRKQNLTVKILITVVAILILFIAFFFVVQPQMEKYNQKKQIEGYNFALGELLNVIQEQGSVAIPFSENESVNLVPIQLCPQIVAAQAQQ